MFKCEKNNEDMIPDKYFMDLHDTLIKAGDFPFANEESIYNIDIVRDTVIDISIIDFEYYSSAWGSVSYTKITPKNGFEIAFSNCIYTSWEWHPDLTDTIFKIDTVNIPKVFVNRDSISINDDFTNNSLMISYGESPGGATRAYHSGIYYWIGTHEYIYFAFRKRLDLGSKLGWLKVKIPDSFGIVLNSCRYVENENILLIE